MPVAAKAAAGKLVPPDPTQQELMSPKEVAVRWGVHVDTVRRLIERGKLRVIVVGRLIKIRKADVTAYYRENIR
ncbi:MAG: excisionase family DNA-binding protein [Acidobacteriota bacterium]